MGKTECLIGVTVTQSILAMASLQLLIFNQVCPDYLL